MLVCTKCGKQNALGRVFCEGCGNKLDLRNMAQQDINANQKHASKFRKVLPWLAAVIVLWILAAAVMLFIPKSGVIGEEGTRLGGRRVEAALKSMFQIRPGMELGRDFSEGDINGYLANFGLESMKVRMASVQIEDGYFFVRVVQDLGAIPLAKFEIPIRLSFDLACVPMDTQVSVQKASIGHLPLYGPCKTFAVKAVHNRLTGIKEWAAFQSLSEIKAEKGKLTVNVKK